MTDMLASPPSPRLLHLDFSVGPVGDSVSRELTTLFADTWRGVHGDAGYRYRDLAADPVPLVGPGYVSLGTRTERRGVVPLDEVRPVTADEEREWALTLPLITELRAADTVLLGIPMYNFTVPATTKAWIDRVSFPGAYTDPDTGENLLRDTRVVVVAARGGCYEPGAPRAGMDFQIPYLRAYFGALGVSEVDFVRADLTRATDIPSLARFAGAAEESLATARKEVTTLAARPQIRRVRRP